MRDNPVLFDLAQYLDAGLDPIAAVTRVRADKPGDQRALDRLRTELRRGRSLAAGLSAAGYAGKLDAAIVAVGEQAGKLEAALRTVAQRAECRRRRVAGLRMRLWLPNLVLAIALLVGIARALTAGTTLATALIDAGITAGAALAITYAVVAALSRDSTRWLQFAWRAKLFDSDTVLRRYFEHTFFTLFTWQASAGVDFVSGATALAALIDDPDYRNTVSRYRAALRRGTTVTTALENAGLLRGGELAAVIGSAEQAGRLAPALEHYLLAEGARLDRITDGVFAWLPRAYYVIVLVLGGSSLL